MTIHVHKADFIHILWLLFIILLYFFKFLYHLRNLINHLDVTADPIHHFNECDDFLSSL